MGEKSVAKRSVGEKSVGEKVSIWVIFLGENKSRWDAGFRSPFSGLGAPVQGMICLEFTLCCRAALYSQTP